MNVQYQYRQTAAKLMMRWLILNHVDFFPFSSLSFHCSSSYLLLQQLAKQRIVPRIHHGHTIWEERTNAKRLRNCTDRTCNVPYTEKYICSWMFCCCRWTCIVFSPVCECVCISAEIQKSHVGKITKRKFSNRNSTLNFPLPSISYEKLNKISKDFMQAIYVYICVCARSAHLRFEYGKRNAVFLIAVSAVYVQPVDSMCRNYGSSEWKR